MAALRAEADLIVRYFGRLASTSTGTVAEALGAAARPSVNNVQSTVAATLMREAAMLQPSASPVAIFGLSPRLTGMSQVTTFASN